MEKVVIINANMLGLVLRIELKKNKMLHFFKKRKFLHYLTKKAAKNRIFLAAFEVKC
ncbi:MAG: hypothetical protein RI983_463 [Bacteroidota bacterium]|jgi:hypothetical protein